MTDSNTLSEYDITIHQLLEGHVTVYATSYEEALRIADQKYNHDGEDLPDMDDVKEGIIASRIAAHAADIAKGVPCARERDNAMANARHKVDWEEMFKLAIDEEKPKRYFESTPPSDRHTCSMCGKMCAVRTTNMILEGKTVEFCQ